MNYDEIELGMQVDYHSEIGGPITKRNCTVRSKPWMIGHGEWVVLISGMSGSVSLKALAEARLDTNINEPIERNKEEIYDQDIKPLMSRIIDICIENKIPMVAEYHIPVDNHPSLCVSTAVVEHIEYVPEHILSILLIQQLNRKGLYMPLTE